MKNFKSTSSGIEVIGAGAGRTGTTSLKLALEILGFDPCYSMAEVFMFRHAKFWLRVTNGCTFDFEEVFASHSKVYKASCDLPASMFWREQLQKYPDAKVILTVRDPEKWYKSCSGTIFCMMPNGPFSKFGVKVSTYVSGVSAMFAQLIVRDFFRNDWRKESLINCFNEHNAKVIKECPKDKLLVYEVGQGWEPLCTFLDKPIPTVPFPNVNDSKAFQTRVRFINAAGYVIVALAVAPVVAIVWCGCAMLRGGDGRTEL